MLKPTLVRGITGHASGRGMWTWFTVSQRTASVFSIDSPLAW